MITLLYGAYGTGQTTAILHSIAKDMENGIHTFLLVPEQETVQAEHQMLHAHTLRFPHPVTGDDMTFYAPIRSDIQAIIDRFEPLKNLMK